jgi:hypothetical protein
MLRRFIGRRRPSLPLFARILALVTLVSVALAGLASLREHLLKRAVSEAILDAVAAPRADLRLRKLGGDVKDDATPPKPFLFAFASGEGPTDATRLVTPFIADGRFDIVVFHYKQPSLDDWANLSWARSCIHIVAHSQTKWWSAKRFLHPDVVGSYKLLFLWDEDIGVQSFNASAFVDIVERHALSISQPAIERGRMSWPMTARLPGSELHSRSEKRGWHDEPPCVGDEQAPPCAALVEVQVPVFSAAAWACVWNMVQPDLIHAFGLDFSWHRCAEAVTGRPAVESMAVVDATCVDHLSYPSLGNQGEEGPDGQPRWVRAYSLKHRRMDRRRCCFSRQLTDRQT